MEEDLIYGNELLDKVDKFKLLGIHINKDMNDELHIDEMIKKMKNVQWQLHGILNRKKSVNPCTGS